MPIHLSATKPHPWPFGKAKVPLKKPRIHDKILNKFRGFYVDHGQVKGKNKN